MTSLASAPNHLAASPPGSPTITVIILTFNEELHIERCISRIAALANRILIVDSFSTDRTVELARACGAEVVQHAFRHQAAQFQWAMDSCDVRTDWILRLDADEYLEPRLMDAIRTVLPTLEADVCGLNFKLRVVFRGRFMRFGGYYSTLLTRLWRTGAAVYEQRWMDEKIVLLHGHSRQIGPGDLVDENLNDIGWWTDKHNRYATRQMVDFVNREYGLTPINDSVDKGAHAQARFIRFARNCVFARAPLYLRSVLYFFYRYFFRLGFLDGRQGFVFHSLHGFWYFMLIDAKIEEARAFIAAHGREAFQQRLAQRYGIDLSQP